MTWPVARGVRARTATFPSIRSSSLGVKEHPELEVPMTKKQKKQKQQLQKEQERQAEAAQAAEELEAEQLDDVSGGARQRPGGIQGEDILNP